MTVSLSKRLFEGDATTASLTSPTPASKRMRMLAPLAEHVGAASQIKAGAACVGALQQQHHSSARKRRHDTSTEHSSGVASPSNSGKRVSEEAVNCLKRRSCADMLAHSFSWLYCLWSTLEQYASSSSSTPPPTSTRASSTHFCHELMKCA